MRRILVIFFLAAASLQFVSGEVSTALGDKPKNVLFIAVDDLRPELGCYGAGYAQSPNIDALAKRSLRFENHFVQVPTCGSSRYALLTGRSPAFSGALGNGAMSGGKSALKPKELPSAQSMPELFRRSGYHTTLIGKISHTADGFVYGYDGKGDGRHEIPMAWDEFATPYGAWKRGWGIFFAYADGRNREDGDSKDVMEFKVENDDDLPDGQMASRAIEKLKQFKDQEKPFFLGLGFFKPHLPFVAPKQDWDAFEGVDIPLPPHNQKSDSEFANNRSGEFFKYDFPYEKKRPLKDDQIQTNRRAYLACVRYTDRQIGRVMKALDETGLADSTVVVFWTDHGWNLGDSRQWAKHTGLERAVRCPMMISVPGMKSAGQTSNALVETIDLFPTLIDVCKPSFTKTEYPLDGKSLLSLLANSKQNHKDYSFSFWKNTISVRSEKYRLIGQISKDKKSLRKVELYSAEQQFDPVKNLAKENPDVVELLESEVAKLLNEAAQSK